MKNQTFGIELEMRHISRTDAAQVSQHTLEPVSPTPAAAAPVTPRGI